MVAVIFMIIRIKLFIACMFFITLSSFSYASLPFNRLEPILARIKEDRRNVVCPIVDAVMAETLEYSRNGGYQVGGFSWSLHFTWRNVPDRDKKSRQYTDPVG